MNAFASLCGVFASVCVCVPTVILHYLPPLTFTSLGANEDYLLLAEHGRLTAAAGLFSDSVSRYHVSRNSLTVIC
jgi:hypothetical protein